MLKIISSQKLVISKSTTRISEFLNFACLWENFADFALKVREYISNQ